MVELRQSTAVTLKFGPFLDEDDGKTVEPGLTASIKKANVRVSKNGGDYASANADQGVADAGAPYDESGEYDIDFDATDTNTLGRIKGLIHVSGALPVWREFMVLTANAWDSKYATDKLQVDVTQIDGNATNGNNAILNLKQLNIQSDANLAAVVIAGSGSGAGVDINSGATGIGVDIDSGASGITIDSGGGGASVDINPTAGQRGIDVTSPGTASAVYFGNSNLGNGFEIHNSGAGVALRIDSDNALAVDIDGGTGGVDINAVSSGDGIQVRGAAGSFDIDAPTSDLGINLSSGSAAISTTADSFTETVGGGETGTYANTVQLDGTTHDLAPTGGDDTDGYYEFDVGANGVPTEIEWWGYANSVGDSYGVYGYNYAGTAYEQIGTIVGSALTTVNPQSFALTNAHVGTVGAAKGKVRFRILSADGTNFSTDRLLCSFANVQESVGYADGAIWLNTNASNTNTVDYVDGVADNPVSTWAAALTLSASLGIKRFRIVNGSSFTLTGDSTDFTIIGTAFDLNLGAQTITNASITGATVVGAGVNTGSAANFNFCIFGTVTLGVSKFYQCGFGNGGGTFTATADGQYVMVDCFSVVPGSGSPSLTFSGLGSATGINNRGWKGGSTYVLDSDCTLSHEVVVGGGCTINSSGADVEIRGITRSLTFALTGAGTIQTDVISGPITISGTTTAVVNLYGIASSLTDTSVTAVVDDQTMKASSGGMEPGYTIDGAVDFETSQKMILAYCSGKIVRTADAYAYRNNADSADVFVLNGASGGRTRT